MTQKEIYEAFKESFGESKYDYLKAIETNGKTTMRCAFLDFVEMLRANGDITEKQAYRITAPKELY